MKNFFSVLFIGFVSGVLLRRWLWTSSVGILGYLMVALPGLWWGRGRKCFLPMYVICFIALGLLYGETSSKRPGPAVDYFTGLGEPVLLEGIVSGAPEKKAAQKKRTVSFLLSSRRVMRWEKKQDGWKLRIYKARGAVQVFVFNPGTFPDSGDRVQVRGCLEKPASAKNPRQFDYRRYLAQKDVHAVLNGYGPKSLRVIHPHETGFFRRCLEKAREGIESRIEKKFRPPETGLFKALIIGKRSEIPWDLKESFIKTGTAHLLAISGLNITLIVGTAYWILLFLKVEQKVAAALSLVFLAAYVVIAGFDIPVRRAGFMSGVFFISLLTERPNHSLNIFFAACLVFIVADPRILTNVSFQLSFLSIFVLILLGTRGFKGGWVFSFAGANLVLNFALAPLILHYFNIFPWMGVLTNPLVIPLFHLALISAILAVACAEIPGLGWLMAQGASWWLNAGLFLIRRFAGFSWACRYAPGPSVPEMILFYLSLGTFAGLKIFWPGRFRRLSYVPLALSIMIGSSWLRARPQPLFQMILFSVGKSDLACFRYRDDPPWLFNAGRGTPSGAAQWIAAPYLRSQGIQRLGGVILTGRDKKCSGGLSYLGRNFGMNYLFYPRGDKSGPKLPERVKAKVANYPLSEGDSIGIGPEVRIEVLGTSGKRLILLLRCRDAGFLILPSWDESIAEALKHASAKLGTVKAILLSAESSGNHQNTETLEKIRSDRWMIHAEDFPGAGSGRKESKISYYRLNRSGALNFVYQKGRLEIYSFLDGPIETLTLNPSLT